MPKEKGRATLKINKETEEYEYNFRIPPKTQMEQNIRNIGKRSFDFKGITFKDGILAQFRHKLCFTIFANRVDIVFRIFNRRTRKLEIKSTRLDFMSKGQLKVSHAVVLRRYTISNRQNQWGNVWNNADGSWNDSVDAIKLIFSIECEHFGEIKYGSFKTEFPTSPSASPLILDATQMFLSHTFSDLTFHCKGKEFPAHRIILACKSTVFNRMLLNDMKEKKEGRIVIEDMEPKVLIELLRFLYLGEVEEIEKMSLDLFIAADKYDLEALKIKCERHLLETVKPETALELYALGESHGGKALERKALEVLKQNKERLFQSPDMFGNFYKRYPKLTFDLVGGKQS